MRTHLALLVLVVWAIALPVQAFEHSQPCRQKRPKLLHRVCDRISYHLNPCGYGKTHHDFGCVNGQAELRFIFGSCCDFFEEPYGPPPDQSLWTAPVAYPQQEYVVPVVPVSPKKEEQKNGKP